MGVAFEAPGPFRNLPEDRGFGHSFCTYSWSRIPARDRSLVSSGIWYRAQAHFTVQVSLATSFFGWELFMALPNAVVWLIGISGLLYTVGVAFYLWERLPYHNTIWHAHVLVASVVLYAANVVAISA